MKRLERTIKSITLIALCLLPTILPFVQASVEEWSGNSSYSYWQGHKVGATSMGVWFDGSVSAPSQPRIELGVSGATGDSWEDHPQPGTYTVTTGYFYLYLTATDIWVDQNSNGQQDQGEPDGDTEDVYFVQVHTGEGGSSASWDDLVDVIYDVAQYLSGVSLPSPFDLINLDDEDDDQEKLTVVLNGVDDFASVRTRVDYYGSEEGDHYITIECKTKVYFYVWHEPGTERSSSLAYTTSITLTHDIELIISVD